MNRGKVNVWEGLIEATVFFVCVNNEHLNVLSKKKTHGQGQQRGHGGVGKELEVKRT